MPITAEEFERGRRFDGLEQYLRRESPTFIVDHRNEDRLTRRLRGDLPTPDFAKEWGRIAAEDRFTKYLKRRARDDGQHHLIVQGQSGRTYEITDFRIYLLDGFGRRIASTCWLAEYGGEVALRDRFWTMRLNLQCNEAEILAWHQWRAEADEEDESYQALAQFAARTGFPIPPPDDGGALLNQAFGILGGAGALPTGFADLFQAGFAAGVAGAARSLQGLPQAAPARVVEFQRPLQPPRLQGFLGNITCSRSCLHPPDGNCGCQECRAGRTWPGPDAIAVDPPEARGAPPGTAGIIEDAPAPA